MSGRLTSRRVRRPARRRREDPSPNPFALALRAHSPSLDAQRYHAFRAGISIEELAARENVKLSTIRKSIEAMHIEEVRYSEDAVNLAARRSIIQATPYAHAALIEALTATREQVRHMGLDENGEERTERVQVADNAVRMLAYTKLTDLIESIKVAAPQAVFNNLNQQQGVIASTPGAPSLEGIIRQIRQAKGLTAAEEVVEVIEADSPLPDSVDFELQADLDEVEDGEEENVAGDAEPSAEDLPDFEEDSDLDSPAN